MILENVCIINPRKECKMQKKQLTIITIICLLTALAAGVAAFHYQTVASELKKDLASARKVIVPFKEDAKSTAVTEVGECAGCAALKEKCNQLRKEKRELVINQGKVAEAVKEPVSKKETRNFSFKERMEEMKQKDPERYEKIQEHFRQAKDRMKKIFTNQREFVDSLDGIDMTESQLKNHEALKDKLTRIDELNALMDSDDEEVVSEARGEFFKTLHSVRELLSSERDVAMESLGKSLGYEGEEVQEFTDYIKNVNQMTSGKSYRDAMRGSGSKRGGGR